MFSLYIWGYLMEMIDYFKDENMILSYDELGNPGENSSEWTYYGEPGVLPQFGIQHDSWGTKYYALTEISRDMVLDGMFFAHRDNYWRDVL